MRRIQPSSTLQLYHGDAASSGACPTGWASLRQEKGNARQPRLGCLTPLYNYYAGVQGQPCDLALSDTYEKTDRQPPRYAAGLSGRRSPAVAHRPKADSQDSRQRMLTAANCPTRIDVVGRRHRADSDPDVWARAQELWLEPNTLGSLTRWGIPC